MWSGGVSRALFKNAHAFYPALLPNAPTGTVKQVPSSGAASDAVWVQNQLVFARLRTGTARQRLHSAEQPKCKVHTGRQREQRAASGRPTASQAVELACSAGSPCGDLQSDVGRNAACSPACRAAVQPAGQWRRHLGPSSSAPAISFHSQNVGMNAHHARPAMQGPVPAAAACAAAACSRSCHRIGLRAWGVCNNRRMGVSMGVG